VGVFSLVPKPELGHEEQVLNDLFEGLCDRLKGVRHPFLRLDLPLKGVIYPF
jgi:hypothetical protein